MASVLSDLNIIAVVLFSCYILVGLYVFSLVFQRITYTLSSPLPLTFMRILLLFMILFWCLFNNGLYLFSCFMDSVIASNSTIYKHAFYVEFYFDNTVWSLAVMFFAYCLKFKRTYNITQTLFDGGKRAVSMSINGQRYSSIDNDDAHLYDRDAPPVDVDAGYRQQRKLDVNDVDLRISPNDDNQKSYKLSQDEEDDILQRDDYHAQFEQAESNSSQQVRQTKHN